MITRKQRSCYFLFNARRRAATSCALEAVALANASSVSQSTASGDSKLFCFSLADQLLSRDLISSAQQLIRRLLANSATLSDALSVVDFATVRGMSFDKGCYGAFMRKLIQFGQSQSALVLYHNDIVALGIDPDPSILSSVIIGYCKIGNLDEAIRHFRTLISLNFVPLKLACVHILQGLFAEEKFLEAFDYFIKICDSGVELNRWYYTALVDGLCYKGRLDEVMVVFDVMRKRKGLGPTPHQYQSLFYALCKRRRIVVAESLAGEMESKGLYVDKMMYTSLIRGYCQDKNLKMAMLLFFRMLKTGCEPDTYTCNTLIEGFMKMGMFDRGWLLYNQMSLWGFQPNQVTDHIMISNYCRKGEVDAGLMLLNSMVSSNVPLNVHSYTVMIDALCKEKRLKQVDELYKKMLANGVSPDHLLSLILIKNCPSGKELELALVLLRGFAAIECGIDPWTFSKSASTNPTRDLRQEIELLLWEINKCDRSLANLAFGIYISALCKGGKYEEASLFLFQLVKFGYRPFVCTCNMLLKCFFQEGFLEEAKVITEFMQDTDMTADNLTYLIVIEGYCKWGNLDSALAILDLLEARGPEPSVAIYDTIIRHLCKVKRLGEAEDIFNRMLRTGVDLDVVFFTTLINGYLQNEKPNKACKLFEKMKENSVQPDSYLYTALIGGLMKNGMVDIGCMYLDRMFADGFEPNIVLYTYLINNILRAGEFEFASRLENLMDKNQLECDLIAYISLISGVSRRMAGSKRRFAVNRWSRREKEMLFQKLQLRTPLPLEKFTEVSADSPSTIKWSSLKFLRKLKEIHFLPNLYLYNAIISVFCGLGMMDDAYDHFHMMQREGERPNQVTFCILMNAHISTGDIDEAIWLFNQMNANGCLPDIAIYNTLLKGLFQAGRLLRVFPVVCSMHKRGFLPPKSTYETLLRDHCANRLSTHAFHMFVQMRAHDYLPGPCNCNWLLDILCKEQKFTEAQIVLALMCKEGMILWETTEKTLMETLNRQREIQISD